MTVSDSNKQTPKTRVQHYLGGAVKGAAWAVLLCLAVAADETAAQSPEARRAEDAKPVRVDWETQGKDLLARASDLLAANPPSLTLSKERIAALTAIDAALQDPAAADRPAVSRFRTTRVQSAVAQMNQSAVVDDDAVIWHVYNMGFVVRTKSATLGFDLVKMSHLPGFKMDDELTQSIIDQCDALFISHVHADHADSWVASQFLAAGKPVLGPESMWKDQPIHDRITHVRRDGGDQSLPIRNGSSALQVAVLPGQQHMGESVHVENNVYVITTREGLRIAHTGDNNVAAGLPSADGSTPPVDVLIMKPQPGGVTADEIVRGFAPRLAVPSHFNEIGHKKVSSRQSYARGIDLLSKASVRFVVLTWGDCYRYRKS